MADAAVSNRNSVTVDEVVTTVIMARVTDFFGFFVYAIASALVFPTLFFPNFDPVTGTLISFAIFSLAFLARPLGSALGNMIQARGGQVVRVIVALMILGTSTMAIGLLPGYDSIGWLAALLLAGLRILQGIGLGASWDGITLRLQNASPEGRKGLYGMVPQLGGPIGFVVAASLFFVLVGFLTDEEFMTFGWRFAFFGVLAVNVVSLFARVRLIAADFGAEEMSTKPAPLIPLLKEQWEPVLISTFMPLASYALFHMVTVFPIAYALLYTDYDINYIIMLQLLGGSLAVISTIISGALSDMYGRARTLGVITMMIPVLCLTIPFLSVAPGIYIVFGFILMGLAHAQSCAIAPARFLPKYRFSGASLSTNLSWIFGAAFAPLVGLALTAAFGLWASAFYLLSAAFITGWVLRRRYGAEVLSLRRMSKYPLQGG
ncbi:MAG: MFS transporter [Pseudomonadota bacterium]